MDAGIHRQELLDLYAEKPNYGELKTKTHEIKMKNPACSDEIIVQLDVKKNIVNDAKFSGATCLISTISAGVLLEKIKGMKIEEVLTIEKKDIDKMLGVNIISTRVKCELLALEAIKKLFSENA